MMPAHPVVAIINHAVYIRGMITVNTALTSLIAMVSATGALAQERMVRGHSGERVPASRVSRSDLGEPMIKVRVRGQTNLMYFRPDGVLELYVNRAGSLVTGSYVVDAGTMCVTLPVRGRDCWPYDDTAPVGTTADIMSDRGQKVRVTYLSPGAEVVAGRPRGWIAR